MRFIARLAMRGPASAAAIAAALLLGSLYAGLLIVLSGAVVALVTLRRGPSEGLRVMVLSLVFAATIQALIAGNALQVVVLCGAAWLPVWIVSRNLGRNGAQAQPLMMIGLLIIAYSLAFRGAVGDVDAFWRERLELMLQLLAENGGTVVPTAQLSLVANQIHEWLIVAMFGMMAGMLLLGRWWQSELYNQGGFGREFCALRLPRVALTLTAVAGGVIFLDSLTGAGWSGVRDVFLVAVILFALQGLAVLHHRAREIRLSRGWFVALYFVLGTIPQLVGPILAATGASDTVADFRRLAKVQNGP
ncbi:MAG: hypothetical protein ACPHTD_10990 [Gammaproteobacteria bacterium]